LGVPKQEPPRERRGSLFLEPFEKRFSNIAINPDADLNASNLQLVDIGLWGPSFSLRISDLLDRFPHHRLKVNSYDDGYQIFFHPVPCHYEFSAVSVSTRLEEIPDLLELEVDNVSFHFGDTLREYRDGFTMKHSSSVR
jgi:hypothetical protein